MSTKIIRYDLRTVKRGTPREIVITSFESKSIKKDEGNIPLKILKHWKTDKSFLGYASFRGLSKKECKKVFGFAKSGKITLGVSRKGNVVSYKIKGRR